MNEVSKPVEQLERPTTAEFQPYVSTPRPVLIRGAAERWPALTEWTPDYLAAKSGNAEVPVLKLGAGNPDGRFFYGEETGGMSKFSECLGLLSGAPARVYMAGVPIAVYLPALAGDVGRLEFVDDKQQRRSQLWISGKDSTGPLHYDLDNNTHVLISGRKRFLMFEYSQSRNLYPCSMLSANPHHSRVDAVHPDTYRFSRFKQAQGYDVTLNPGEMIYIPTGCWHQVITEEPSVAVNFWLGKSLFRRSTMRIFLSVALTVMSSPWRAIRPQTTPSKLT
jgi:Cupin-like domain